MDKCSTSIVTLIKQASVSFQKADVAQQLAIEALRAELRLSKLFASQPRPTSIEYESTIAVLFKLISDQSLTVSVPRTMLSNPHKYDLPSMLPRDLERAVTSGLLTQSSQTYASSVRLDRLVFSVCNWTTPSVVQGLGGASHE
jgi:hypothetical protein